MREKIAGILDVEEGTEVVEKDVTDLINDIAIEFEKGAIFTADEEAGEALTAEETAVNNAFSKIEDRDDLDAEVTAAVTGFGNTSTGAVLNTITALQDERQGLIDAVTKAEEAVTTAEATATETQALVDQLNTLETAIENAETSLTNAAEDGGLGVNLVDFTNCVAAATGEDDIILFSAAEDGNSISSFGAAGDDRFYVGTDFTQVDVAANTNVADTAQGDASVLEVFVQQTGGDTVLFFEEQAFGGSSKSAAELTPITLTGVTGDVSISDDGFLTVA